jgi:hypothetical protein
MSRLEMKYFVLKPRGTDVYADASRKAMRLYAIAIERYNKGLADDLMAWVKKEEKDAEPCNAVLYHGPGHQSKTLCQRTGVHKVHECVYGSDEQFAQWYGVKASTGAFDEPPEIEEEED